MHGAGCEAVIKACSAPGRQVHDFRSFRGQVIVRRLRMNRDRATT
jgi:hypothetical protein